MSNPNNAAPSTAAKKEAKKGLRRYTSFDCHDCFVLGVHCGDIGV